MPTLESLSIWKRIVLALVVLAVVVLILFGLSLVLEDPAPAAPATPITLYEHLPINAHLLRIDKDGLEEAYRTSIIKLWTVWLSSGAPKDATNMRNGLAIARRAYGQAAEQISKREVTEHEDRTPP